MRADGQWEVSDTAAVWDVLRRARVGDEPFDLAVPGQTEPDDGARSLRHDAHRAAGATWWIEGVHPWRYGWSGRVGDPAPLQQMLDRIRAGP
jgi:hypothetical protein